MFYCSLLNILSFFSTYCHSCQHTVKTSFKIICLSTFFKTNINSAPTHTGNLWTTYSSNSWAQAISRSISNPHIVFFMKKDVATLKILQWALDP